MIFSDRSHEMSVSYYSLLNIEICLYSIEIYSFKFS